MEQSVPKESTMPATTANIDFDEVLRGVGPDSTATFDNSPSDPTAHASSENLHADAVEDDTEEEEDDEDEDLDEDDDEDLDEDDDEDELDDEDEEDDEEDEAE